MDGDRELPGALKTSREYHVWGLTPCRRGGSSSHDQRHIWPQRSLTAHRLSCPHSLTVALNGTVDDSTRGPCGALLSV